AHPVARAGTGAAWRDRPATPDIARGVPDALDLAREALANLPDDRRSHLVTPRELTQAIEALAAQLPQLAAVPKAVLSSALTAVDLARTLASERDDDASTELL